MNETITWRMRSRNSAKFRGLIHKQLFDFARRLGDVEKAVGLPHEDPTHLGKGNWRRTAALSVPGESKEESTPEPASVAATAPVEIPSQAGLSIELVSSDAASGAPDPEEIPARHSAEKPTFIKVRAPLPAWCKESREAVERMEKELPPLVTITAISEYFGVSYTLIHTAVVKGRLAITHKGDTMRIPRESVAEYVRVYGVPRPRKLFYGSSTVREYQK